jgi:hypothetical protein
VIGAYKYGANCVIRNNSIIHSSPESGSAAFSNFGLLPFQPASSFSGNVVYLGGQARLWHFQSTMPASADHNVVYLGGTAQTGVGNGSWADWQLAGYDANGVNADPLLVNVTPGFEDLRLQAGSPARDLIPASTLTQDAFGNPRPMGLRYDAGAHEFEEPEIAVRLNATDITHAGAFSVGTIFTVGEARTFTIHNLCPSDLHLTGSPSVMLAPGANCGPATAITTQPALTTIPYLSSTTFTVQIQPAAPGLFDLQIAINNNDADESPFYFTVTGTGVVNAPAQADPAPGSSFSGPANGPMVLAVSPGAALANAVIDLSDAEADPITVTSITPPGTPPTGITGPTPPAPGHPVTLVWSGVADAFNPPGAYSWVVEFVDAVSGTPVACTVTIAILDVPPAHLPAGMTSGAGSPGNPYLAAYLTGADSAQVTELCVLSDANATQTVGVGAVVPGAGNPSGGAGFVIDIAGGMLRVAPAGVLLAADEGTHEFTVTITDSTNLVDAHVRLTVSPPPPLGIATSTLPDGEIGKRAIWCSAIATGYLR